MNQLAKFLIRFFVWAFTGILLLMMARGSVDPVAGFPILGVLIISEHYFSGQISSMVAAISALFAGFFLVILYQGADQRTVWLVRLIFVIETAGLWGLFLILAAADKKIAERKAFYSGELENGETKLAAMQEEIERFPGEISKFISQRDSYVRFSQVANRLCEILIPEKLLPYVESLGKELLGRGSVIAGIDGSSADVPAKCSIEKGIPVIVRDSVRDGRIYGRLEYRSSITCPLETGAGAPGFLQISDSAEFNDGDLRFFSVFSGLVSVALTNSLLYRKTAELAVSDSLTGLYVQYFFKERLEEEFKRARTYGDPLSLIIFDIDFFKAINDNYGHPCGDEILKQLSAVLRKRSRSTDIIARYGGEEFAMIMVQTTGEGAIAFAEEIRRAVSGEIFAVQPGKGGILQKLIRVKTSVSAGVAALRGDESDYIEFIRRSDEALYRAKKSGRNRVEFWNG